MPDPVPDFSDSQEPAPESSIPDHIMEIARAQVRSEFGKLGGKSGGLARASKLSPERRSEIASLGGKARAAKLPPQKRAEIAAKARAARGKKNGASNDDRMSDHV